MPTHKVGTQISKKQRRQNTSQKKATDIALSDDSAVYAKVTHRLGNKWFSVVIYDEKNRRHIPDIKAKIQSRNTARVELSSVVNVALAEDDDPDDDNPQNSWATKNWEIISPLDEQTVRQLKKDGKISDVLATSTAVSVDTLKEVDRRLKAGVATEDMMDDGGIEFVRDEAEDEDAKVLQKKDKTSKKGMARVLRTEDDDVNIDAI
jgi:hypothetical protein